MKIVPFESLDFNTPIKDYYTATNEALASSLYVAESWHDENNKYIECDYEKERFIVTFAEIEEDYNQWDQSELADDEKYTSAFDYLRDVIHGGFYIPVKLKGE